MFNNCCYLTSIIIALFLCNADQNCVVCQNSTDATEEASEVTRCKSITNLTEAALHAHLATLNPGDYQIDVRPKKNAKEPVIVRISIGLFSIKDFNEPDGTLVLDGYMNAIWQDEFHVWNTTFPYLCLEWVVFRLHPIWRPSFVIATNSDSDFDVQIANAMVMLSSAGEAQMYPSGQFTSSCEPDVTFFPFDTQECRIVLEGWTYDSEMQMLTLDPDSPFMMVSNFWTENRQWELAENVSYNEGIHYSTGATYGRVYFKMLLRRKPLFFHVNVIIPSLIISIVELVIFLLPANEVEKLSISVTCLLAYSVFQSMIIMDIPRNGHTIPLLMIYINLQMSYIGFITILSEGVVFCISYKATTSEKLVPPSSWLLRFSSIFGKLLFLRNDSQFLQIASPTSTPPNSRSNRVVPASDGEVRVDGRQAWLYIADLINRINFVIYITAIILTPLVLFYVLPPRPRHLSQPE